MLFVGTSAGAVRSLRFPLATPGEWSEFRAHGAAISKVTSQYYYRRRLMYYDNVLQTSATVSITSVPELYCHLRQICHLFPQSV